MVESRKTTLSSQFVQLPDTPTNFHLPSTSRSTKLAKSLNPSPQLPHRERIQYGSVFTSLIYITRAKSSHGTWDEAWRDKSQEILWYDGMVWSYGMYQGHLLILSTKLHPDSSNSTKESRSGPVMSVTYLRQVFILPIKFHPDISALSIF